MTPRPHALSSRHLRTAAAPSTRCVHACSHELRRRVVYPYWQPWRDGPLQ